MAIPDFVTISIPTALVTAIAFKIFDRVYDKIQNKQAAQSTNGRSGEYPAAQWREWIREIVKEEQAIIVSEIKLEFETIRHLLYDKDRR